MAVHGESAYNENMSTNPLEIELTPEQRRAIAEAADRTGKPWSELLEAIIDPLIKAPSASFHEILVRSGAIGLYNGPTDLSTNPDHLKGLGADGP